MTETAEVHTGEMKEQPDAHMVDMKFEIPDRGVDYQKLMDLGRNFTSYREADGRELGVISMGAHIDTQEDVLRVIAHIDGLVGDTEEVAEYIVSAVAQCGVETPHTIEVTTLSQAS